MGLELTERGIGLELIQYNASLILAEHINDEIDAQQNLWDERDANWANVTGQEPSSVVIEHILTENIFRGHRPSLIESDVSEQRFPNISVMAYTANNAPNNDIVDQMSNFTPALDIEIAVKGESEAQVDARIHRTVESVHQVFVRNEYLNGISLGWDNDPIIRITDIYKRKSEGAYGEYWFWQMARLRYSLTRHTHINL